jgi:outer membrane lipoprotein carrier protein
LVTLSLGSAIAEPWTNLNTWLSAQKDIRTWSADFTQTRAFKALTQPLTATGHVWFVAPDRFRWELRQPAQTIAVRQTNQVMVIYPRLKRAEIYPLGGEQRSPWQDTLALLEAGFPRSAADIESRFRVLSVSNVSETVQLNLQPKSTAARRWVSQIQIVFATNNLALLSTELRFPDGSSLRNDFTNATLNAALDEALFNPKLDADFKIVEPLKK